eukprot:1950465-Pleurochrysis_carterae.AAC.1
MYQGIYKYYSYAAACASQGASKGECCIVPHFYREGRVADIGWRTQGAGHRFAPTGGDRRGRTAVLTRAVINLERSIAGPAECERLKY